MSREWENDLVQDKGQITHLCDREKTDVALI